MKFRIVDLSVRVDHASPDEPWPAEVRRVDHRAAALQRAAAFGIAPDEFPEGLHLANEEWRLITHVGTHMDAPWHYGPTSGGRRARFIDEIPLEWCFGPGVVLDVSHRGAGEEILQADLERSVREIGYTLRPGDIVLLHTGCDAYLGMREYLEAHPGLSREGLLWLLDQGIRVIGIDAYSLDRPFRVMADAYQQMGTKALFPAHYAGREREYCQIEKLCNLKAIGRAWGFWVAAFPIKLAGSGAGWVRAVALVPEEDKGRGG
ncbi:MAG: cyclase family protein [Armatimonadetes bacterium]|nr:cyclase family protein [Armatimonadota bacterium]MDW8153183.1 cyclase family protein [Armatimonadota bacterium]